MTRDARRGSDFDRGSSSSQSAEGQPEAVAGLASPAAACGVESESTEAGVANLHANVSHDPSSANCVGSRAPLAVTVMRAPDSPAVAWVGMREVLQSMRPIDGRPPNRWFIAREDK